MAEQEQSRDIMTYVREKEAAKEEVKKIQSELAATKSKLYDASVKIDQLQEKIKSLEGNNKPAKQATSNGKAASTKKGTPAKTPQSQKTALKTTAPTKSSSPANSTGKDTPTANNRKHPPITGKEELSYDSVKYYGEIARLYPDLKLSTVLEAENKFNQADVNGDGVVDSKELDDVLCKQVTLFTQGQVQEIFQAIDQDGNDSIEFIEILAILEKMGKRRQKLSDIPASIQDSSTKVCAIQ